MQTVKRLIAAAFGFGLTAPLLSCGGATIALTPQPPSAATSKCSSVPVAAAGAPGSIFPIPAGVSGTAAECQAIAAYRGGQVLVAYNDSTALGAVLGEAPWSDQGSVDLEQFQYASSVNDGQPLSDPTSPPLSDAVTNDSVTVYAAYYDAASDAPVEFSAAAPDTTTAQQLVTAWATAPTSAVSTARLAKQSLQPEAISAPSYDTRAWTKVLEESWQQVVDADVGGSNSSDKRPQGNQSGFVTMYRLNTNDNANDYFLVDLTYTQGPRLVYCNDAFTCVWFNDSTSANVALTGGPNGSMTGRVLDISPTTIVSKTSETLSVGGKLSGKVGAGPNGPSGESGGEVSVGWSRTIVTDSVNTTNDAARTVGTTSAGWNDTFNHDPPFNFPSTSQGSYTADRLAIFTVPRTVNDASPGYTPAVSLSVTHEARFFGWWIAFQRYTSTGTQKRTFRVPLPAFYLRANGGSTLATTLSLSLTPGTSATFDVVANQVAGQKTLKWFATKTPSFVTTNIDPNGETGNQSVTVNALPSAAASSVDYLLLNTIPAGGADSVRNGSLRVQITITK